MSRRNQNDRLKKMISDTEEFRMFQYLVYKFEITALKITDVIADKLCQLMIALILSLSIQSLAVFDISKIDTMEISIRSIFLLITLVCIRILKRAINLKNDRLNSFVSSTINIVMILTISNLISGLKIYHSLTFKLLVVFAALFWIASLINRGSDMYLDDEK